MPKPEVDAERRLAESHRDRFDAFAWSFTQRHLGALPSLLPTNGDVFEEEAGLALLIEHVTREEQVRFLRALIAEGDRRRSQWRQLTIDSAMAILNSSQMLLAFRRLGATSFSARGSPTLNSKPSCPRD